MDLDLNQHPCRLHSKTINPPRLKVETETKIRQNVHYSLAAKHEQGINVVAGYLVIHGNGQLQVQCCQWRLHADHIYYDCTTIGNMRTALSHEALHSVTCCTHYAIRL